MSHLSVFRILSKSFSSFSNINGLLSDEQEKESIIHVRWGRKKSVPRDHHFHHWASLVMPMDDPRDRYFYPILTLMIDSPILSGEHLYSVLLMEDL